MSVDADVYLFSSFFGRVEFLIEFHKGILAVCKSEEEAERKINEIVENWVQEILSQDPADSGIDATTDLDWLRKDCRRALNVQIISN